MKKAILIFAAAAAAFACFAEVPLKVAVFVGDGARGMGVYRWLEIASTAENAAATPVDAISSQR